MHKKILGICVALVALAAFAVAPTIASASPVLTVNGTAMAAGEKVIATNDGVSEFLASNGSVISCNNNVLTGTVDKNKENQILGTIETGTFNGTGTGGDCTSGLGNVRVLTFLTNEAGGTKHWCIESEAGDKFKVKGGACTAAAERITFTFEFTEIPLIGKVKCSYIQKEGAEGTLTGSFNTNVTPTTLALETGAGKAEFTGTGEGNSGACPASGRITVMNFNLFKDNVEETGATIS